MRDTNGRKVISVLLALVMVFLLSACTGTGSPVGKAGPAPQEVKAEKAVPVTVTDHLNRKVKIQGKIEKIVSGYYITTSMLIALGLKDKVTAIEAKAGTRPVYKLAAPEFLKLPNVGTAKEFNLEACLALKPDLVILPVKLKDSVATLEKMGLTVIAVNPENMDLLKETVGMIGKATGSEGRAERLIQYYDEKLAQVKALTGTEGSAKKVYLASSSDLLSTSPSKMYQSSLIETAGGINAAADINDVYWTKISYEQLVSYNPDIIVIASMASYSREDVLSDPRLKELKAIKSKAVFKMPDSVEQWDSPVPSGILGTLWLASILHGGRYSFDMFREDAGAFYKEFYNIDIKTEDISK